MSDLDSAAVDLPPWHPKVKAERLRAEYLELMGREPPDAGDHPLADQWDYRGTPEERRELAQQIATAAEPVPLIDGQIALM